MITVLLILSCRDTRGPNRPPSITAVWLTPPAPTTDGRVRVVASTDDEDGDPVSLLVTWEVNGQRVETGMSLDGAWFSEGDRITAVVVPTAGRDGGAAVSTSPVVVANSPPSLSGVTLSPPDPVRGQDALTCSLDAEPTDADGEAVTVRWRWFADGVKQLDERGHDYDAPSIPGSWTVGGQTWQCMARLSDGDDVVDVVDEVSIGWPDGITPLSAAEVAIAGASGGDGSGSVLSVVDDIDGDGAPDLLIGADLNDTGGDPNGGAAWLLTAPVSQTLAADGRILGESAYDRLGSAAAPVGEGAFALGAWASNRSDTNAGAVFVMSGAHPVDEADLVVLGAAKNDHAGAGLARAGDADGDGVVDLLIGAPGEDTGGSGAGAVWLVSADLSGVVTLEDADALVIGVEEGEGLGEVVAGIGDADGDGLDDVLIGAPEADAVVLWTVSGSLRWAGEAGGRLGAAIAGVEDVDGDGLPDVAMGAPDALDGAGRVRLCSGADGAWLGEWLGGEGDAMGAALAALPGGGLLIGATGLEGAGGVHRVEPEGLTIAETWVGITAGDAAGSAVDVLGTHVVIGAPGADDSGGNSGTTWLLSL